MSGLRKSAAGKTDRHQDTDNSRVRFCLAAAVCCRGKAGPFPTEEEAESWCRVFCEKFPHTNAGSFATIRIDNFKTLRSTHRFGHRWNVGSSNGKSHHEAENAPILGAFSSVVSHRAFQGLTRNTAGTAPSFFAVIATGAKKE